MFSPYQLRIVAKLLRVALAYESREVRIRALLNNKDPQIAWPIVQLKFAGYLKDNGIVLDPE
jgi:hypothetical protein